MTYKAIRYSDHASNQMVARSIRRVDVRSLLASGERIPNPIPGATALAKQGVLDGDKAIVIYLESQRGIYIITVMWLT